MFNECVITYIHCHFSFPFTDKKKRAEKEIRRGEGYSNFYKNSGSFIFAHFI